MNDESEDLYDNNYIHTRQLQQRHMTKINSSFRESSEMSASIALSIVETERPSESTMGSLRINRHNAPKRILRRHSFDDFYLNERGAKETHNKEIQPTECENPSELPDKERLYSFA